MENGKKTIDDFVDCTDEEWLNILIESVNQTIVGGLEMPRFPSSEVQAQFVGSSKENALIEASNFYKTIKAYAAQLGRPIKRGAVALDFGCGWGRYLRFLWKDIGDSNLYGVDVDPDIIKLCKENGVPGNLDEINPFGRLPYKDNAMDVVLAYSVFTHLPEPIFNHWISEIKRVSKPGCIFAFTIEPRRFLEFIGALANKKMESDWHIGLAKYSQNSKKLLKDYDDEKFIFLPTGGGAHRGADIYGDAVIPISYVAKKLSPDFKVWGYIDEPSRFWQAVVIAQMR